MTFAENAFAENGAHHLCAPPDGRPAGLSPGPGTFRFLDDRDEAPEPLPVRYYLPPGLPRTGPVVFVMHGTRRNAAEYRDSWAETARRLGFLLVCPEFPSGRYPRKAYQLGGLVDGSGGRAPQESWTFGKVERLFDLVKALTGNTSERYHIYGHSAGAQFVHRLALFAPWARFATAVAANSGWYTMPTYGGKKFPYGLRRSGVSRDALKEAFGRRLVVLLGERDTDAGDPTLRKTKAINRQGSNRFERGNVFYATASREAARLGAPLNWSLRVVPGARHYDPHMMPVAAQAFFSGERVERR